MKTYKIIILTGVLITLSAQSLSAQTVIGKESRKVQVTFAYPVGSAGINSRNYANNFSFNILYGLNGGVKGFEFGSLWNHNDGDIIGFQLSGLVIPYTVYEHEYTSKKLLMWIGFNAGLSLNL